MFENPILRHPLAALAVIIAIGVSACGAAAGTAVAQPQVAAAKAVLGRVDVLVFAPHPDDETIGAAGVLQQALAAGKRVRVVFVTNGDGYPQAAARLFHRPAATLDPTDYVHLAALRQREATAAAAVLGVNRASLVFLGYPDGALAKLYGDRSRVPIRSPRTGRTATYGPVQPDYHSMVHGRPAPYTRAGALADVEEVLRTSRPGEVLVTDRADQHPDHSASYHLVHDAIAALGYKATLLTFVVHSGCWPSPRGPTPDFRFQPCSVGRVAYPIGVPWPPPLRVRLSAYQAALKLKALTAYHSQWAILQPFLSSFTKSEEIFWTDR